MCFLPVHPAGIPALGHFKETFTNVQSFDLEVFVKVEDMHASATCDIQQSFACRVEICAEKRQKTADLCVIVLVLGIHLVVVASRPEECLFHDYLLTTNLYLTELPKR